MTTAPIRLLTRVRWLSVLDAVTYVLLVGVAMPLKYGFGQPMAVSYAGWIHGILFISLAVVTFLAWISKLLSFRQSCLVAIGALLPFGPFVVERWLPRENER